MREMPALAALGTTTTMATVPTATTGTTNARECAALNQLHHHQQQLQEKRLAKRRARKPTFYVRKEEKEALEAELALLHTQLAFASRGRGSRPSGARHLLPQLQESLRRRQAENDVLRDALRRDRFAVARVQSALNRLEPRFPFESHIRLSADCSERRAVMLALRDAKIRDAHRYVAERAAFADPSAPSSEITRFVNAAGDMCKLVLEVVAFEGVASVKQVFDALLFYVTNMEISVTEALGDVTVRDGEEIQWQGVTQNRLLSSMGGDVQVEFNALVFFNLSRAVDSSGAATPDGDVGVIVANSVSEDALYPYCPESRLRYDVVAGITVELAPRSQAASKGRGSKGEAAEQVVVMKRTVLLRLHQTDLPVPPPVMQALRQRLESWGDVMLETVRGVLYPRRTPL